MRDDDYIMRLDGKGYCRSCKLCINKMRFKNTDEWRKQREQKELEKKKEQKIKQAIGWANMYK